MEQFSGMYRDRSIFEAFPVGESTVHKFGDKNPFIIR
jgi:hypothetical protein